MRCLRPLKLSNGLQVNCGFCRACRVNRSSAWTLRLLYEFENWKEASFITLTYSDEEIPEDFGLCKRDLQLFLKRLRERFRYIGVKIRYFAVGEYGLDNRSMPIGIEHGRPHYHLIVFGVDAENESHRKIIYDCWRKCEPYLILTGRGVERVCRASISYVTGYVQKKLTGDYARETYQNRQVPFMVCSQKLGLEYFSHCSSRLLKNGYTYLGNKKIGIPRYFRTKYDYKLDFESKPLALEYLADKFQKEHNFELNSVSQKKRFFNNWIREKQADYADKVDKDFIHKKKIRGGKL